MHKKLTIVLNCVHSVIDCGKPVVPPGVRLLTDSFSVHSEARLECELGHKLIDGELKHKCGLNGKWSGRIPVCTGIMTLNSDIIFTIN